MVLANFWKRLFSDGSKQRRRSSTLANLARGHAQIERLESRCYLSVSSVFNATTGTLAVTSNASDAITVGVGTDGRLTLNGATLKTPNPVAASAVISLTVTGGSGNNRINLSRVDSTSFPALTSVSIDGGAGNDNIVGSVLSDGIKGGAGNDTLNGGSGNDSLSGDDGIDDIQGGNGDDRVDGGNGNDRLNGDNGNDTLNGGEGNDSQNGQAGDDQLNGGNGHDTLNGGDGNDFLNGQDGDDQLNGNNSNDSIFGGRGNDRLNGGAGADQSTGGDGKDNISNDGHDEVLQDGDNNEPNGNNNDGQNGNNHEIQSASGSNVGQNNPGLLNAPQSLVTTTSPPPLPVVPQPVTAVITYDSVSREVAITGTASNDVATVDVLTGNLLRVRVITGLESVEQSFALDSVGRVTFNAGDGNDSFITVASIAVNVSGGGGNDSIITGLGSDTLDGGDGADTLLGTGGDDTLVGGTGDDCLRGGSGNDSLDGGAGNDQVFGEGSSFDTLRGGLGNDTLDGGNGTSDLLSEAGNVNFTLTATRLTGLGTDTLLNLEGALLVGGSSANKLDVSLATMPTTLTGGLGNDTILGGTLLDTLVESGNANFKLTASRLTGLGTDTISGIDQAQLTGGAGANLIDAGTFTKPVTLLGGDGNDTLIGGSDVDRIDGGAGNDRITGGAGANTLFGGDGTDRIVETSNAANFTVSNSSVVGTETERIYSFEEAELTGGASANFLTVASNFTGPVTLNGGLGNDTLVGNQFSDVLNGGAGNDSLNGGTGLGNDALRGGDGNDTLLGQAGDDSLDGGAGNDIGLGAFGNDTVLGGAGRDLVIGGYGVDSINGGNDEDIVFGGTTNYDGDVAALAEILTTWTGTATYSARVALLRNTAATRFLKSVSQITDNATVYDDYVSDTVSGGAGFDFFVRPGDATRPTIDRTPDRLATETMDVSVFGTEAAGFFPSNMTQPGYLQTLADPTFGTPITRITGDAGSPLTLPVNTGGTASIYWSGAVRTRYVTDSSWNADGSLMMLRSYDPGLPYQIVLDGSTYQPLFLASVPTTNLRWSQNPATPTVQYGFLAASGLDTRAASDEGVVVSLPAAGPDDDKIVRYDVTTGQVLNTITLPFNKLFSTKTTIAFVNGHEYAAMYGVSKTNPSATAISVYIVQLDADAGQDPVVASQLLTTTDSGTPDATFAQSLDFSNLWFSPDGRHLLTLYTGATTAARSWRLLDVDYTTGAINSHAIPDLAGDNAFQTNGDRTKGHFPVNWSHPVFALGANGDVSVVGVSGQFNGRSFSPSEIATANGRVGSVLAFNVTTNTFRSLTDPTNENLATHITATNTQHSGYVFVSYWNDSTRGSRFSGELVAINVADPFGTNGTIELAHHRTNVANRFYHGNTLPTVSPDGRKLIFSSTWGTRQNLVQTYVLDLDGIVP